MQKLKALDLNDPAKVKKFSDEIDNSLNIIKNLQSSTIPPPDELNYDYFKSLGFPEESIRAALFNVGLMRELESESADSMQKFKNKMQEIRKLPFDIFWLLFQEIYHGRRLMLKRQHLKSKLLMEQLEEIIK